MAQYFYVRVSTLDQNSERQFGAADALGVPLECIFHEKLSGKTCSGHSY
ncbi:MAG: hypothetical protein LBR77_07310 [Lachnospiraceae bacterium]|jgi:DNA invertase Pin-like site-specific DNA recombinase|nr:hypothetical protein [Lachnospiraceae bacterium]